MFSVIPHILTETRTTLKVVYFVDREPGCDSDTASEVSAPNSKTAVDLHVDVNGRLLKASKIGGSFYALLAAIEGIELAVMPSYRKIGSTRVQRFADSIHSDFDRMSCSRHVKGFQIPDISSSKDIRAGKSSFKHARVFPC